MPESDAAGEGLEFVKPDWVNHDGVAIYSVDVHPLLPRFATGGADHVIRVWSLSAVSSSFPSSLSESGNNGSTSISASLAGSGGAGDVSRRLATLARHTSPVNAVRWNPGGWFLASGSDDHSVLIWEKVESGVVASTPFGSDEPADPEAYRVVRSFRAHVSDVNDLAFSPDGTQLASCGVDGRICIYQLGGRGGDPQAMHIAKMIENAHSGLIKGIAWDPIGKYIATQGDDKAVRLFRVLDWELVTSVTAPYTATTEECFTRRLSWSPDGQHLATPHANNGVEKTAAVLRRDAWSEVATEFVGHSRPVGVCRYAPALFARGNSSSSNGNDNDNDNSDNGKGKGKGKAGAPSSSASSTPQRGSAARGRAKRKRGGDSNRGPDDAEEKDGGAEDVTMYTMCAVGAMDNNVSVWVTGRPRALVVLSGFFADAISDLSFTADGRTLIAASYDGSVAAFRIPQSSLSGLVSEATKNRIFKQIYGESLGGGAKTGVFDEDAMIETVDNLKAKASAAKAGSSASGVVGSIIPAGSEASNHSVTSNDGLGATPVQQREVRLANGKRRITPMQIGDNSNPGEPTAAAAAAGVGSNINNNNNINSNAIGSKPNGPRRIAPTLVSSAVPTTGSAFPSSSSSASASASAAAAASSSSSSSSSAVSGAQAVGQSSMPPPPVQPGRQVTIGVAGGSVNSGGGSGALAQALSSAPQQVYNVRQTVKLTTQKHLRGLPPLASLERNLSLGGATATLRCIVVEQRLGAHTSVSLASLGSVLWRDRIAGRVVAAAGTSGFIAVGIEGGGIIVYTAGAGRRIVPRIELGGGVAFMSGSTATVAGPGEESGGIRTARDREHLLVIATDGSLRVWDLSTLRSVVSTSVLPLLGDTDGTSGASVKAASIAPSGQPVVVLSTGTAHTFHSGLGCWVSIADDHFSLSVYHGARVAGEGESHLPLSAAQSLASRIKPTVPQSVAKALLPTDSSHLVTIAVSHLEHQLASSLALGSGKEYTAWMGAYVGYLAQEGLEARASEVFSDLLGKASGTWEPTVLGIDKRQLLRELLASVVKINRGFGRLATEFTRELDAIDARKARRQRAK